MSRGRLSERFPENYMTTKNPHMANEREHAFFTTYGLSGRLLKLISVLLTLTGGTSFGATRPRVKTTAHTKRSRQTLSSEKKAEFSTLWLRARRRPVARLVGRR